jgi:hypothetical protein
MSNDFDGILNKSVIEKFIAHGFIRLDNVFSKELAAKGREILWADTGCDPDDPATWTKPVIRLGNYPQAPFREAANSPILHAVFDKIVGKGRWLPLNSLGTFPIRFPSDEEPGDTGWHAEASFAGDDGSWRLNVNSKGRALLMLFLFSDISEEDAPTRILMGSHLDVPSLLQPAGENGLSFIELAQQLTPKTFQRDIVHATGEAGTVYICHPFLIHAAQLHHGTAPRFMAQPPLLPATPLQLDRKDENYSPVEMAIRIAL